jgi:enterochelin esterase-like enzyme
MENKLNFINIPTETPKNVTHKTFFYSNLIKKEIGYNIYLPCDYENNLKRYPILYHLHGWEGNESSDIWTLENTYQDRDIITVFVNGTPGYLDMELPMESIIITELIPYIDEKYRTDINRESRSISGFSMGGAGAFYYAIKYLQLFGSVIAYAGTYHHFFHSDYKGVGEPAESVIGIYEKMMSEDKYFEKDSILYMIKQNAPNIRDNIKIKIHIGNKDILYCDNEILHLFLNSYNIPHEYKIFDGIEHELGKILF